MPHLLREYAKNLGVKISKPIVKEHFFPINFDAPIAAFSVAFINKFKNFLSIDIN